MQAREDYFFSLDFKEKTLKFNTILIPFTQESKAIFCDWIPKHVRKSTTKTFPTFALILYIVLSLMLLHIHLSFLD